MSGMTWLQSLVLALLQGVTELFPISSLGHTVIVTALLGWSDLLNSPSFLPFLVLFHLGTATALFLYFWRDWAAIIRGFFVTAVAGRLDAEPNGRLAWLLIAGTIPAGLIGLFLETPLKGLFANPSVAAVFLAINGVILLIGERARRRAVEAGALEPTDKVGVRFTSLSWREAVLVGLAQALALIPGISRSGVTMVAALRVGMNHEDAAAYTFLLATPIIGAAALLEIPQLAGSPASTLLIAVVGGVVAGIAAYLSTRFLMRYFEHGRLDPFGYYCIVAGLASFVVLLLRP
jgi:undecaprenyl-diphosphatase